MPKQDKAQNLATKRMGKLNQVLEQINQEQAQQIVYKDRRIVELEHAVAMLERVGEERAARIQTLLATVKRLQQLMFGKRSEKLKLQLDSAQLVLEGFIVELGAELAADADTPEALLPSDPPGEGAKGTVKLRRKPRVLLPEHLPKEVTVHEPDAAQCACGGDWQKVGEDESVLLERLPERYVLQVQQRPRYACRCCKAMAQADAPSRPLVRSYAGAGLLAQIMVSKYQDSLPLYRQGQMLAREGIHIPQTTLADWVGGVHRLLNPLTEALRRYVLAGKKLHADDTPIKVLEPGSGKTRTGRLWSYVRDERPYAQANAPAVWFAYSADRKGEHPQKHLKDFRGCLQADAYSGFAALYRSGKVIEAGCWAHARRGFMQIHSTSPSAMTTEVLAQIQALYRIERHLRGRPPDERRQSRQVQSAPILEQLRARLLKGLSEVSQRSATAKAIGYVLNQWEALGVFVHDGRVEIDNNIAENAIRTVAIGRKNYLFLGSDEGGDRAATLYSLLGTARLNGVNPLAYLTHVLKVINDHKVNAIDALLPWRLKETEPSIRVAEATLAQPPDRIH